MPKHPAKPYKTPPDALSVTYSCKARNPTGSTLKLKSVSFTEAINTLVAYLQPGGTAEMTDSNGATYRITNADGLRMEMEES